MAMIEDIGKAKVIQLGLERAFNARPSLDIQDKFVRVYYYGNELKRAQNQFNAILSKQPGAVRVELTPVLMPGLIKKYGAFLFAFFAGGLLLGKQIG